MKNAAPVNKKAGSVEGTKRSAAGPFVVKFVTLAFLLTIAILGALVWHAWDLYRDFKVTEILHLRTAELSGVIAHLDEVLTMSARMSAATGDPKWESRYGMFEPKLAAAIEEAKSLWPEALIGEAMAQTDAANVKLVAMERKAFGLVREGKLEAASALLYSPEYEKQKQIYSEGIEQATVLMRGRSKTELRRHGLAALTATAALAVISVLVALLWLAALRVLKRYVEERKRAELSLRLSEQCFRAIADYTYFWEVWVSAGGRVLWTNPAVERITGYNIDELKAMSDYPMPLIYEEDRGRMGRAFKSALRGGSGKEVQFRLQQKDGKVIWADMSWQPIYDDKGFSQGHRASIREITQRKEAEEALRKSEQMLQLVLDTIPVRVFWKDRDSVYVGCNSLFAKDAGLTSPEEIVGKTDHELGWKEQADLYRLDDARVIRTGEAKLYYEEPQTTPDGKRIWLRTSKIPLRDLDGTIIGVMGTYEDITERKRSEDALRLIVEGTSGATGEEFFRCLVKALASTFGFRYALVGEASGPERDRIRTLAVWMDKDFAENFEYELAGTPCETVVGQRLCLYRERVQEQFPEDHLLADLGVESYLGAPLFGYSGDALGLLAVMDDKPMGPIQHAEAIMTIFASRATAELEREVVSRALARGEKRFRSVAETASDAIISADSSGNITFWNSAAEKMFGYSADEIIGKPLTTIMPKRYRRAHLKGLNRVVTTGKTRLEGKVVELAALKKDGSEFPVSLSVASWGTEEGLFFTAIIRDITQRKGAEEALRQSEERYRNVYDTAPLAFVVWDNACSISGWNKRAEEVFGWSQKEVKGKNFFDFLIPESDRPRVDSVVKSLLEGRLPSHSINYNLTKEGKTILCEWNNAILRDSNGEIVGAISMALDITERKQAEEARDRLNRELEAKNKELESILYVASHDLKSPLVNIEGFSGELSHSCDLIRSVLKTKGIESNLDKDARAALNDGIPEALGFIATSTNKMDSLLSGLLRLSRLGQAAIKIEPLDMNATMSNITGSMEYQIKQAGATVEIGTLPPCLGDASQINQVFSNLLDNAINWLESSRAGAIQIYGRPEGNMSIYCIEDNGVGIAAEYHEKIFEIFQQLEPGKRSGEGLGLTIVRRILDRHNGKIWLESEIGKGSTFFVSLPSA